MNAAIVYAGIKGSWSMSWSRTGNERSSRYVSKTWGQSDCLDRSWSWVFGGPMAFSTSRGVDRSYTGHRTGKRTGSAIWIRKRKT